MLKKVLIVVESLAGGGAENVVCNLVNNLNKSKYEITLLSIVKTGIYVAKIDKSVKMLSFLPDYNEVNSVVGKLKYKFDYHRIYHQSIRQVYRKYIKEKYDIEIAFIEGYSTKLVASSDNMKSKKICWLHIDMESNPYADKFYDSVEEERKTYQKYDHIIAVSNSVKEAFERKFSMQGKVLVRYNPVDSNEIVEKAKQIQESRKMKGDSLKIVTIGRLEKQKGYDRLLKAVNEVRDQCPSFTLWILGDGTQKKMLQDYIEACQLQEIVKVCGFQRNPYQWLAQADAFFCSSREEGFSTVATEAIILGKPVFTTECAGMRELFGDRECGKIFENSVEGISTGLKELLQNQEMLAYYGAEAEKRALDFSIEKNIKEIEEILESE